MVRRITRTAHAVAVAGVCLLVAADLRAGTPLRDFVGINGHWDPTYNGFPSALYSPAASLVRDYHPMNWDVNSPSNTTTFPMAANGVDWGTDYGQRVQAGFRIDLDVQFETFSSSSWGSNMASSANKYGKEVAGYFGSAPGGRNLANSIEIGNEVNNDTTSGGYSDAQFQTVFSNMAQGIRSVDPSTPIVTCNVTAGPTTAYARSIDLFKNMTSNVDVFAIHTYAFKNGYPTWERSYPEDPSISYLSDVQAIINWRNQNAPGKQVWVTEFGYDSTTKPNETTGTFANEVFVNDTQQAQYLVRSYLAFARMGVNRAYAYYYNDADVPELHASSGLTRSYVPKPSYYAISHLQATLGNYAFSQAVREDVGSLYVYSFTDTTDPKDIIWAMWSPTGSGRQTTVTLNNLPGTPLFAEQMPLAAGSAPFVPYTVLDPSSIQITVGESPVYLRMVSVPEPTSLALLGLCAFGLLRRPDQKG